MSTVNEQLAQIVKELQAMYDMVLEAYSYMPVVYEQKNIRDGSASVDTYVINTHLTSLPMNSLLYVLPKYTSNNDTLYLKVNFGDGNSKTFMIYIEDTDGTAMKAGAGSLIANRLAVFRLTKGVISTTAPTNKEVVMLTNNPHYNTISTSNLHVAQRAQFKVMPVLVADEYVDESSISKSQEFCLYGDYLALLKRVEALENKFVIGEDDIEEVKDSLEEGQIYLKVEDFDI